MLKVILKNRSGVFGSYHFYASITIVFWSLAYVLTRIAMRYTTALPLGLLRYAVASITLLIVVCLLRIRMFSPKDVWWFLLAGASGFFVYVSAFNKGNESVGAATGSTVIATVPIITAVMSGVIYREHLRALQWIGIAVSFVGVVLLTVISGGFSVNIGLAWLFCAAICLSLYNVLNRRLTKTYSAIQVTAFSIFAGTLMLLVFIPQSLETIATAPPVLWITVLALGVLSSAVAYLTWAKAFSLTTKAANVSNYMYITPILTALLGYASIGEVPDRATIVGGAVILIGLGIFAWGRKNPA
ncbi:MAG: DMT family transporter [Synergistaceae bacterium]|jgi:drug/metabolite transporter (DMT)-like permease|nr:DMT family transporter [Synergistaceae bacterium]